MDDVPLTVFVFRHVEDVGASSVTTDVPVKVFAGVTLKCVANCPFTGFAVKKANPKNRKTSITIAACLTTAVGLIFVLKRLASPS